MPRWDPAQYERFADARHRPFRDLLARIHTDDARLVVDLGCGNGPMTLELAGRWPQARVIGIDSSADMLERARDLDARARVEWVQADVTDWSIGDLGPVDVLVTNATLQWIPEHLELIPRWLRALAPGGTFAMQVPGNFQAASHRIIREVAATQPRGPELTGALRHDHPVGEPQEYAAVLADRCAQVDVWETTYLQLLQPSGRHPVLEWVKGTALRPLLDLLDGTERDAFLRDLAQRLEQAYPQQPYGTPFPFRRIFAVGRVPGETAPARGRAVLGLHHVQVTCRAGSEGALRSFYTGVLGLPEVPKPPGLAARGGCWFRVGPQQLHLGVDAEFMPARKAHPCILVADVDAVAAAVSADGGAVRWDDNITGVRRFHTDDPCGNRVEVQHHVPTRRSG